MLINNKYHVTYCTNIHGGSDWAETFESLQNYVPTIKKTVSNNQAFGLGLRLSNKASEELNEGNRLSEFKNWLNENHIYVFTMNGFPYGNFHNEVIKDNVHTPDWTTKERVNYTKRLFNQLAFLLPKDTASGGISTSPISYKHWYKTEDSVEKACQKATNHLVEIAMHLIKIETETGKYLHLDIEPEPDGFLENTEEVLSFYKNYLLPIGIQRLAESLSISTTTAEKHLKKHITLCYDVCHFSLAFETPEYTFSKLASAGIKVGKIQISAALKIISNRSDNSTIWEALSQFNEPTYLHQVTEKVNEIVTTYNDLPIILEQKNEFEELRAHFHVPIFLEKFEPLFSTQNDILTLLEYLKINTICDHLEIETYTWDVLPENLQVELSESISREMEWLINHIN